MDDSRCLTHLLWSEPVCRLWRFHLLLVAEGQWWCFCPLSHSPHQVGGSMPAVSPTSMEFTTQWATTSGNSTESNGTTSEVPATHCAPPPWWCDPMTSNPPHPHCVRGTLQLRTLHLHCCSGRWRQSEVVGPNTYAQLDQKHLGNTSHLLGPQRGSALSIILQASRIRPPFWVWT